mmetsp:Transcript_17247/g.50239  ORF Transcript_17247/g.50239 Transcript_17247/m.50239 type:complete len:206 (+) Transcript_17247:1042-1659(+)
MWESVTAWVMQGRLAGTARRQRNVKREPTRRAPRKEMRRWKRKRRFLSQTSWTCTDARQQTSSKRRRSSTRRMWPWIRSNSSGMRGNGSMSCTRCWSIPGAHLGGTTTRTLRAWTMASGTTSMTRACVKSALPRCGQPGATPRRRTRPRRTRPSVRMPTCSCTARSTRPETASRRLRRRSHHTSATSSGPKRKNAGGRKKRSASA